MRAIRPIPVCLAVLCVGALIVPASASAGLRLRPAAYKHGALIFRLAGISPSQLGGAVLLPGKRKVAPRRLRRASCRGRLRVSLREFRPAPRARVAASHLHRFRLLIRVNPSSAASHSAAAAQGTSSSSPPPLLDPAAPSSASRFFASDTFSNNPLAPDACLAPNSSAMVAGLVNEVDTELASHHGPWINTRQYSTPIYTVPADQPTVHVTLDRTGLASMQKAIDAVPIPPGAEPAAGTDEQLVIWQPSSDRMWEFWKMEQGSDGWHARAAGAIQHLSSSPGYYTSSSWPGAQPWWGATATGLPLVSGLITIQDLQRGRIDHALAMAIPHARAGTWSWPATHGDGDSSDPNSLPEGARLRLDPNLDINSLNLPPLTRMIAEAAQRYGIVIRDRAGVVALYGQDPTPTGSDPWKQAYGNRYPDLFMAQFPWSHLRVLRLSLHGS